jgi:hypothetical protein
LDSRPWSDFLYAVVHWCCQDSADYFSSDEISNKASLKLDLKRIIFLQTANSFYK